MSTLEMNEIIRKRVQEDYHRMVEEALDARKQSIAKRLYAASELEGLPLSALTVALGLGNPVAAADIQAGETVLDLGSGGGIDSLLAARRTGAFGRVTGVDITASMIELARRNAQAVGLENLEFVQGSVDDLHFITDCSVDVVLSNGVMNLVPDKAKALAEIYRVLKPGMRVVLSDMVVNGEIPPEVLENPAAWSG